MSLPKQSELFLSSLPIEKVHGALLGAAVGDALGWPQEYNARRVKEHEVTPESLTFQTWRRRCGGRFYPYEEHIRRFLKKNLPLQDGDTGLTKMSYLGN